MNGIEASEFSLTCVPYTVLGQGANASVRATKVAVSEGLIRGVHFDAIGPAVDRLAEERYRRTAGGE